MDNRDILKSTVFTLCSLLLSSCHMLVEGYEYKTQSDNNVWKPVATTREQIVHNRAESFEYRSKDFELTIAIEGRWYGHGWWGPVVPIPLIPMDFGGDEFIDIFYATRNTKDYSTIEISNIIVLADDKELEPVERLPRYGADFNKMGVFRFITPDYEPDKITIKFIKTKINNKSEKLPNLNVYVYKDLCFDVAILGKGECL